MSVTDGQHKVPIAIHRPAASLQLLEAKGWRSREAGSRAPARGARGSPPPGPEAHRPQRGDGSWEGRSSGPATPWAGEAEADTGIFAGSGVGMGGGRRVGSCESTNLLSSPSLSISQG